MELSPGQWVQSLSSCKERGTLSRTIAAVTEQVKDSCTFAGKKFCASYERHVFDAILLRTINVPIGSEEEIFC